MCIYMYTYTYAYTYTVLCIHIYIYIHMYHRLTHYVTAGSPSDDQIIREIRTGHVKRGQIV